MDCKIRELVIMELMKYFKRSCCLGQSKDKESKQDMYIHCELSPLSIS